MKHKDNKKQDGSKTQTRTKAMKLQTRLRAGYSIDSNGY